MFCICFFSHFLCFLLFRNPLRTPRVSPVMSEGRSKPAVFLFQETRAGKPLCWVNFRSFFQCAVIHRRVGQFRTVTILPHPLRRGHANLLCIVPILVYVLREQYISGLYPPCINTCKISDHCTLLSWRDEMFRAGIT